MAESNTQTLTLDAKLPSSATNTTVVGALREGGGLNVLFPSSATNTTVVGALREGGGLNVLLPCGAWTLYFHPAKETRWHMDTYKVVTRVTTFNELAQMFAEITATDWARGKFFFTPDGIPPLMENAKNIRGGSYSLRVDRTNAGEVMQKYILAAVLGRLMNDSANLVSCVRITPRRDFNILQVWNRDCQSFGKPSDIGQPDARIPPEEVQYKPHFEKKI